MEEGVPPALPYVTVAYTLKWRGLIRRMPRMGCRRCWSVTGLSLIVSLPPFLTLANAYCMSDFALNGCALTSDAKAWLTPIAFRRIGGVEGMRPPIFAYLIFLCLSRSFATIATGKGIGHTSSEPTSSHCESRRGWPRCSCIAST